MPELDRLISFGSLEKFMSDYPPFICELVFAPELSNRMLKAYLYDCPVFYKGRRLIFTLLTAPQVKNWVIYSASVQGPDGNAKDLEGAELAEFVKKPRQAKFNSFQVPLEEAEKWALNVKVDKELNPVSQVSLVLLHLQIKGYICSVAAQKDPEFVFACRNERRPKGDMTFHFTRTADDQATLNQIEIGTKVITGDRLVPVVNQLSDIGD
ncbi:hypothetical protein GCM10022626_08270 [[Pseudomonas] carboxydohydrogena]